MHHIKVIPTPNSRLTQPSRISGEGDLQRPIGVRSRRMYLQPIVVRRPGVFYASIVYRYFLSNCPLTARDRGHGVVLAWL